MPALLFDALLFRHIASSTRKSVTVDGLYNAGRLITGTGIAGPFRVHHADDQATREVTVLSAPVDEDRDSKGNVYRGSLGDNGMQPRVITTILRQTICTSNLLHGEVRMKTDRSATSVTALNIVRYVKSKGYRVGDPIPPAVLLGAKGPLDVSVAETNAGIEYAKSNHWMEEVPMSNTLCLSHSGWAQV